MGRLIETKYSEITATLERLDESGVTNTGLKNVRTMSPALLKQLAFIIENRSGFLSTDVLPGLVTFDVTLDSRSMKSVREKIFEQKIFPSLLVFRDILKPFRRFPVEKRKFIFLTPADFGILQPSTLTVVERLASRAWLKDWSLRNLLGSHFITPTDRPDAAVHIALAMSSIKGCPRRMVLVHDERNITNWLTINSLHEDKSYNVTIQNSRPDFSYNCPAVFELQKI